MIKQPWLIFAIVSPIISVITIVCFTIFWASHHTHKITIHHKVHHYISQLGVHEIGDEFVGAINQAGEQYNNPARFKQIKCKRLAPVKYNCLLRQTHPSACKSVNFTFDRIIGQLKILSSKKVVCSGQILHRG